MTSGKVIRPATSCDPFTSIRLDVDRVESTTSSPLQVEKSVYVRIFTKEGPLLEPVTGPLAVGDELIVRVVVRVDRDMEWCLGQICMREAISLRRAGPRPDTS